MNSVSVIEQVSLIHASCLLNHSVSTHLTQRCRRFSTLPLSSTAFPCGSRLRLWLAGSSSGPAVSSSSSYGLVIHLLLLSTTHRCVAVAFGYRPESVCLKRTCTSLTTRAFRRTSPAFQRRERARQNSLSRTDPRTGVVAMRRNNLIRLSLPALKRRAKLNLPLRG